MKTTRFLCLLGLLGLSPLAGELFAQAPVNDNFANAQTLTLGTSADGTTLNATRENGDPEPDAANRSVWYTFTPGVSQIVRMSATATTNPLEGYLVSGSAVLSSFLLGQERVTYRPLAFYAVAGHTYHLCIDDYVPGYINYAGYPFTVALAGGTALPADTVYLEALSNDNFADAYAFSSAGDYVTNTTEATFEPFEQDMLAKLNAKYNRNGPGGVWFSWTAPATGTCTITGQTPTNTDVILVVGTGDSIADLNLIGGADNGGYFSCQAGTTYKFYVLSQTDGQVLFHADVRATGGTGTPSVLPLGGYIGVANHTDYLLFTLSGHNAYSARVGLSGRSYGIHGQLDAQGAASGLVGDLPYTLQAAGGGTGSIADDTITIAVGSKSIVARPRAFASTEIPSQYGPYTAVLHATDASASIPQGRGLAGIFINRGGAVGMVGRLPDGQPFTFASVLTVNASGNPELLILSGLSYAPAGYLAGTIGLTPSSGADFSAALTWHKPQQSRGAYYQLGFDTTLNLQAAHYVTPAPGDLPLPLATGSNNATVKIAGPDLATITETVTVTANKVTVSGANTEHLTLSINPSTAVVTGSFIHPASHRPVGLLGILYQNSNQPSADGLYGGPVQAGVGVTGSFTLTP